MQHLKKKIVNDFFVRVTNLTAFCLFVENNLNFGEKQVDSVAQLCWFLLIRPNLTHCISSSFAWVYDFEVPVVAMSDMRRLISIDYEGRCERAPHKPCCLAEVEACMPIHSAHTPSQL